MKTLASLTIAAAALGAGAGAVAYKKLDEEAKKKLSYDAKDMGVRALMRGIAKVYPGVDWPLKQEHIPENFYAGTDTFIDTPKAKAKWSCGYASSSILGSLSTDKGRHYIAGYLKYPPQVVTGVLDDQCIRAIALDDGSGRGIGVFAVIDCIGMASGDIRKIRGHLQDFAKEHNIHTISISSTHCHCGVDTQGLWGDLLPGAVITNYKKLKKGETDGFASGRNADFMENLYKVGSETIKSAVLDMKKGKLFCAVSDEKRFSRDKRQPDVFEKDLTVLRFVPDDKSKETVAVFGAAHPIALGEDDTKASSDYPYYMVDELKKNNYNGAFFQGPQLAISVNGDVIDEELSNADMEGYEKYGRGLARYAMSLARTEKEKEVAPILNVRIEETYIPAENEVYTLIAKARLVNNIVLKTGKKPTDVVFVTEVGYVQLGENQRFALIPGELAPELLLGGAFDEKDSYRKQKWELPPMNSLVKEGAKLTVIGLCNDSIGYILPSNDYGSMFAPQHYEESVSAGPHAGETIVRKFAEIVAETAK